VKWRLTSSFPKSLDTLWGASATVARVVGEMTDGKFVLTPFAAGEIVPSLQVLDAVANNTVECGHSYTGYYIGKNPSFIFDGSLPFGFTPRMQNAWMMFGDGRKLMDEVYDSFKVVALPAGQTGGQMFGWFRKEIKSVQDFQGLKFRTAGFGGKVMMKLGAVPQQIAGGDIYPAMERGTIDACEWVGPYDDEKLGFHKVAKVLLHAGRHGAGGGQPALHRQGCLGLAAAALPGDPAIRLQLRDDRDAGVLRCQECRGHRPPGGRRHPAVGAAR
jgi:TRAP-type mannitol/chloroaromatic compound transport system substrate-binding protein